MSKQARERLRRLRLASLREHLEARVVDRFRAHLGGAVVFTAGALLWLIASAAFRGTPLADLSWIAAACIGVAAVYGVLAAVVAYWCRVHFGRWPWRR